MLISRPLGNIRRKQGFPKSGMKPETTRQTADRAEPKDIQGRITRAFAQPHARDFMSLIAMLMETYGVMNLSKATGIDRVTLWRFMRGDRLPRLDTLQKILSVLGIKVQFSFEERMKNFLEYTYWRRQWEDGSRSNNTSSHQAGGTAVHQHQTGEKTVP